MFKPNSTLAVVSTLVLCCLPVFAATNPSDEMQLRIGGAKEVSPNHYEFVAGSAALLAIKTSPGDLVWCFAVAEDKWGEADYSNILPLVNGFKTEDGLILTFVEVPVELGGMTFHVQAVGLDQTGKFKFSPEAIIDVLAPDRRPELTRAAAVSPSKN